MIDADLALVQHAPPDVAAGRPGARGPPDRPPVRRRRRIVRDGHVGGPSCVADSPVVRRARRSRAPSRPARSPRRRSSRPGDAALVPCTTMRSHVRSSSGRSDDEITTPSRPPRQRERVVDLGLRRHVDAAGRVVEQQQPGPAGEPAAEDRPSAGCRPRASVTLPPALAADVERPDPLGRDPRVRPRRTTPQHDRGRRDVEDRRRSPRRSRSGKIPCERRSAGT